MPTTSKPALGCQTIYDRDGSTVLFLGQWDPRVLVRVLSPDPAFWFGKRVLDIGANTSGLSIEMARRGASVVALEPDAYKNTLALARPVVEAVTEKEGLDLSLKSAGLFDAHAQGRFDAILCLGLVYHFRDPQYVLDYLSTIDTEVLFVSTQTAPGDELALYNRRGEPSLLARKYFSDSTILTGWHPTQRLFTEMLRWAGFDSVEALTPPNINFPAKPDRGLTNSAYFRARKGKSINPIEARRQYLPR